MRDVLSSTAATANNQKKQQIIREVPSVSVKLKARHRNDTLLLCSLWTEPSDPTTDNENREGARDAAAATGTSEAQTSPRVVKTSTDCLTPPG